jgi:hypothetical protein
MTEQQYEQDQQTIGRYEVFMYGQDVAMLHTGLESIRTLNPTEALRFLRWLHQHREDLDKATQEEEGKLVFQ